MKKRWLLFIFLFSVLGSSAQQDHVTKGNYEAAARFSPIKLGKMVFSTTVSPHWLKQSGKFWYAYETSSGKNWYLVDPVSKNRSLLFDKASMATKITRHMKQPFDEQYLPIDSVRFSDDEKQIFFQVKSPRLLPGEKEFKTYYFRFTLGSDKLELLDKKQGPARPPVWASVSPDGEWVVFARNHNIYKMNRAGYERALNNTKDSSMDQQLTKDGQEFFSYASIRRGDTDQEKEKTKGERKPASVYWSPDSKHFYLIRSDERLVKDLWVIHSITDGRPELETYKYQMAGEKETPQREMVLFDVVNGNNRKINTSRFKDQEVTAWDLPELPTSYDNVYNSRRWMGTNSKFYFTRVSRDLKKTELCTVEVASGEVTPVIAESFNTYIDTARIGLVNGGDEIIYRSEEDGWSHFYLYDEKGKLKNQITSGSFHCGDYINIDEKNRTLYFLANGKEEGEDPYYTHLYKVRFDGTGLTLLNKGNFDHTSSINDKGTFFVDNYSRVNTIPESALYDNTGKKVISLEKADLSLLFQAGYKFPTPFKVKADDGITDLYGVMYTPFDMDSSKKYPLIEFVYPGPQTESVNTSWGSDTRYPAGVFSMDRTMRLAQLGFVVITVGNRGGHPDRSKWYHTYGYGNLRDYGLADKKAAAEQLSSRHSFIDFNRIGITGRSGGGFMSTAAMLVYPDVFKVAVAEVGNHENNIYNRWWSEKHHGVQEIISNKGDTTYEYSIDKNPEIAKNLKGRLLLAIGDIDNNVHPAATIRMANQLIKAGKRFEFVFMPNQRHVYTSEGTEYFFYMMGDYFVKYLLGDFSQQVDISELQREWPKNGKTELKKSK